MFYPNFKQLLCFILFLYHIIVTIERILVLIFGQLYVSCYLLINLLINLQVVTRIQFFNCFITNFSKTLQLRPDDVTNYNEILKSLASLSLSC